MVSYILLHIESHKQAELHVMYAIGMKVSEGGGVSTTLMPQAGLLRVLLNF